jgi:hypothetical protein
MQRTMLKMLAVQSELYDEEDEIEEMSERALEGSEEEEAREPGLRTSPTHEHREGEGEGGRREEGEGQGGGVCSTVH